MTETLTRADISANLPYIDNLKDSQERLEAKEPLVHILELSGFFAYIEGGKPRPAPSKVPDGCRDVSDDDTHYIDGLGTCEPMDDFERASRRALFDGAFSKTYELLDMKFVNGARREAKEETVKQMLDRLRDMYSHEGYRAC